MRLKINRRIVFVRAVYKAIIENVSLWRTKFFIRIISGDHKFRLVGAKLKSLDCGFNDLGVIDIHLGLVVADDLGSFSGREIKVCRV